MPFPAACFPKAGTLLPSGFDPLGIASMSDWLDYRTLASVGDGNPVNSWTGRKNVLAMTSIGTGRFTYAGNDGDGKPSAQSDGVNDYMECSSSYGSLLGTTGEFESWFVLRGQSNAQASNNFFKTSAANLTITWNGQPSLSRMNLYCGGQSCYGNTGAIQDNVWHVIRIKRTVATVDSWIDGVEVGFGVFGSQSWFTDSMLVAIGGGQSLPWLGAYRHALFFNSPLDDATAAKLTTYLQAA